jgi:metal-sulfur cluster biosynthetic enzyme
MSEQLPPANSEILLDWLKPVQDPELFLGLVDLGLIYSVTVENGNVQVKMTLTSPGCPAADHLVSEVKKRLLEYPGIQSADVSVVFEPKWDPRVMASDEVKDRLGIW